MNKIYNLSSSDALLVADMQIDFLPGGALPIANADELIPVINDYIKRFREVNAPVLASRDWHPPNHMSFKEQGGSWPPHCVQNTDGANFHPNLKLPSQTIIFSKATDPKHEAYSAFDGTNLAEELHKISVKRLFIAGVATDYCVVNTVLDAQKLGFETIVLMDAVRGIDVNPDDVKSAVESMLKSGAEQATVADFPNVEDRLPLEKEVLDELAEKTTIEAVKSKRARLRSRGAKKRIKTER